MMQDPSYCYKFYWLEAIVQLILEDRTEASYDEIIDEMIANAWYSILEFHIHLSGIWGNGGIRDNLEKAVIKLRNLSELSANASKVEIKNKIREICTRSGQIRSCIGEETLRRNFVGFWRKI